MTGREDAVDDAEAFCHEESRNIKDEKDIIILTALKVVSNSNNVIAVHSVQIT